MGIAEPSLGGSSGASRVGPFVVERRGPDLAALTGAGDRHPPSHAGGSSSAQHRLAFAAQDDDRVAAMVDDVVGGAHGGGVGIVRVDALAGVGAHEQVVLGRRVVRRCFQHGHHVLDALDGVRRPGRHDDAEAAGASDEHGEAERARQVGVASGSRAWPARLSRVTRRRPAPGCEPSESSNERTTPRGQPSDRSGGAEVDDVAGGQAVGHRAGVVTTSRPSGSTSVAVPSMKPLGSSMRTCRPSVPSDTR